MVQWRKGKVARWMVPTLLLVLFAPFSASVDLAVSDFFFRHPGAEGGAFVRGPWARWVYHYAIFPALLTSIGALFFLLRSYMRSKFMIDRRPPLLLLFTLLVGSGIVSNALFKEYWGRPRPIQTEQFGGSHTFLPFYQPNLFHGEQKLRSFPSGHSTMGFFFFSVYVIGRQSKNQRLARLGLFTALALGALLGAARLSAGGHYFSDVVVAAWMMWCTVLLGERVIYAQGSSEREKHG